MNCFMLRRLSRSLLIGRCGKTHDVPSSTGLTVTISATSSKKSSSCGPLQNSKPLLTLYTKDNCSLCVEAKEVLMPVWHRFEFEEIDIEEERNKEWFDKYRYDIPVFHLNGKYLMRHKVNLNLIKRKLNELEQTDSV